MVEPVPEELRRFVRTFFRSMLQLEGLLLVASDSERWWSAADVNRQIRASEQACQVQLESLAALGLLESRGEGSGKAFRFGTQDPALRASVEALRDFHGQRYHTLIDLIYAIDRAQEFAEAFRLRKKKDG
jgi:hypothetical protein